MEWMSERNLSYGNEEKYREGLEGKYFLVEEEWHQYFDIHEKVIGRRNRIWEPDLLSIILGVMTKNTLFSKKISIMDTLITQRRSQYFFKASEYVKEDLDVTEWICY